MNLFNTNKTNTTSIRFNKKNKKSYLDIFYFNMGNNPYILIKEFKENKLINTKEIKLNKEDIDLKGSISDTGLIINELKELKMLKGSTIDLKIDSLNIFKSIVSLPRISSSKANTLKKKEIKNSFDKYSKSYHMLEDKYTYEFGIIYEEYFISNELIRNWVEISKRSNLRLSSLSLFSNFLFNEFVNKKYRSLEEIKEEDIEVKENKNKKKKDKIVDFSVIHVLNNVVTFILSSSLQLIDSYSFEFKNEDDLIKKYITIIGKHEIEFEKKLIKDIYLDSDTKLSLNESFKDIKIHPIQFDYFNEISTNEESNDNLINKENTINE